MPRGMHGAGEEWQRASRWDQPSIWRRCSLRYYEDNAPHIDSYSHDLVTHDWGSRHRLSVADGYGARRYLRIHVLGLCSAQHLLDVARTLALPELAVIALKAQLRSLGTQASPGLPGRAAGGAGLLTGPP